MGKHDIPRRSSLNGRVCRYTTLVLGATAFMCAGTAQAVSHKNNGDDDQDLSTLTFPEQFQKQVVEGSEVHGRVGFYDFRRWHDSNQPYPGQADQESTFKNESTAFGAQIGISTGRIYGFSAGGEFVYETPLYDSDRLNANLADRTVTNLTQGYLQFNAYGLQIRGGRQLLNTPLANTDQYSFLPRSFQGVSGVWRPLQTMNRMSYNGGSARADNSLKTQADKPPAPDSQNYETDQNMPFEVGASPMDQPEWQIFAAKITRYEGRGSSDGFHKNNRYFQDVDGFWSIGTSYRDVTDAGQIIAQYYHYRFQQTESADYGEVGYMAPTIKSGDTSWAPYVRAQVLGAYDADKSRIPDGINNQIYGLKLGIDTDQIDFSIFGNFSPEHNDSFGHGRMLHPYSDLSGVVYSDTMNNGLTNLGPGWAAGARLDFTPTDNLAMYARYVRYQAKHGRYHDFLYGGSDQYGRKLTSNSFDGDKVHNQRSEGIGLGLTYNLGGIWKQLDGLKIGDNLGITKIDGAPNFYDNRVRVYYSF